MCPPVDAAYAPPHWSQGLGIVLMGLDPQCFSPELKQHHLVHIYSCIGTNTNSHTLHTHTHTLRAHLLVQTSLYPIYSRPNATHLCTYSLLSYQIRHVQACAPRCLHVQAHSRTHTGRSLSSRRAILRDSVFVSGSLLLRGSQVDFSK